MLQKKRKMINMLSHLENNQSITGLSKEKDVKEILTMLETLKTLED